jgi:hypothetical protein
LLAGACVFCSYQYGKQPPVEAQWRERVTLNLLKAQLRVLEQMADPAG